MKGCCPVQDDMKDFFEELGSRLRAARKQTGLSVEDAAKRMGISHGTLRRLEFGGAGASLGVLWTALSFYGLGGGLRSLGTKRRRQQNVSLGTPIGRRAALQLRDELRAAAAQGAGGEPEDCPEALLELLES